MSSRNGELLYNDDLDVGPAPTGLSSAFGREKSGWRSLGGVIQ